MNKPTGYDDVKVGGDFTPITLGGHHLIIKGVREEKNKDGKDMLVAAYDFAKNDSQPGYFSDQFEKDVRPDKKWPFAGTKWIMVNDYNDSSKVSKDFKRFITSVEVSNGIEVNWGDKFAEQFKGKRVGGVFGEVEEEYNGEIRKKHLLRWFCEDGKADGASIPNIKALNNNNSSSGSSSTDFMKIPDSVAEEIPF